MHNAMTNSLCLPVIKYQIETVNRLLRYAILTIHSVRLHYIKMFH